MKKIFLGLLLLGFALNSFAQNKSDSTNSKVSCIIKLYPFHFIIGELRTGFEIPLKRKYSIDGTIGFVYTIYNVEVIPNVQEFEILPKAFGYSSQIGLRYYPSNKKFDYGFFLSPIFSFKYYIYPTPYDYNFNIIGLQLITGYKLISKNRLSIECYLGAGIKKVFGEYSHVYFTPNFGFILGYNLKKK